ncbi:MAG: hypothetical protein EBZ50_02660 [Alphaproteobacteria bacterium]|nr:hypothetical protein [Alphaproteobacteria bacterium]
MDAQKILAPAWKRPTRPPLAREIAFAGGACAIRSAGWVNLNRLPRPGTNGDTPMAYQSPRDVPCPLERTPDARLVDTARSPDSPSLPMRQIAADTLNSVVESEIIPRLLLAHQSPPLSSSQALPLTGGGAPDIDAFAGLALTADIDDLSRVIDAMLDTGVSVQDMFSRLLAPTARRLGVYWEQDISSFTDVAIALGKMQRLVRHYSRPTPSAASGGRRVLLAAVPGEDHTFGLAMIAESFRLANWSVFEELDSQLRGLEDLVRTEAFDAVGLSVASDAAAAALPDVIRILRAASVNRALIVLVGGFKIMERPELARDSGADATAGDGPSAVAKAVEMLDAHVQRV